MKYLVTGGTGFIGSALVRRLVKDGFKVRVIDNDSRGVSKRLEAVAGKIEIVKADIRDAAAVQKACRGIDSVCHLAYVNGTEFFYSKPDEVLDIAVKGMVNIINGCIQEKVKEFILASSSEVYQTPPKIPTDETVPLSIPDVMNPRYSYGGGKIISELMAINYGRKYFKRVIIFRPHNVYGPDMGYEHVIPQFVLRMKKLCHEKKGTIRFPIQGTGTETRSFVYIDDFIDGLMLLLKKAKHLNVYHIGTTNEIPVKHIVKELGHYFGRNVSIIPSPPTKGATSRRCPDISKLKKLGYAPKVTFKEGLCLTAKWYCEKEHSS